MLTAVAPSAIKKGSFLFLVKYLITAHALKIMNSVVLVLVLCSAMIHAYWNFVLKKAINKGADNLLLYWLSGVVGVLLYSVVFFFLFRMYPVSKEGVLLAALCGFFLAAYVFFLSASYKHADLSKVYPLAKITPVFTLFIGVFLLDETVHVMGILGILLVVFGIYVLHLRELRDFFAPFLAIKHKGSFLALMTAIVSAGYGLFSKLGVNVANPFVFVYLAFAFTALFYTPLVWWSSAGILSQLRQYKKEIVQIGFLDMFGYSLILVALSLSQLSYVFALRQISIILSVLLGVYVFNESCGRMRLAASGILFVGVVLISLDT